MSTSRTDKPWLRAGAGVLALGVLVVLLLACVLWIPKSLYPSLTATDLPGVTDPARVQDLKADRSKLQNDARTTWLQGYAALLVLIGAGIGASVTLRQVRATREGQVTDRYTKAIDQLDAKNALAVRLGGLYALERIARDSPDDRATIAEVLCAYARTAPRADPPPRSGKAAEPPKADASPTETSSAAKPSSLAFRAPDVQAALTILGRWQERLGVPPLFPAQERVGGVRTRLLDLHEAEIQGASLRGAQLQDADIGGAQLQDAFLNGAQLQDAFLGGVDLEGAFLDGAQLQDADIGGAQLQGAYLGGADLQGAKLVGAQLQSANLMAAQLQGANLKDAQLQGALLRARSCRARSSRARSCSARRRVRRRAGRTGGIKLALPPPGFVTSSERRAFLPPPGFITPSERPISARPTTLHSQARTRTLLVASAARLTLAPDHGADLRTR